MLENLIFKHDLIKQDLISNAQFALDEKGIRMNSNAVNHSNFANFFRITDLGQGHLGKSQIYFPRLYLFLILI
jgi:hypothetical protein